MVDDPLIFLASSKTPADEGRPHLWPLIIIVMVLLAVAVSFFNTGPSTPVPVATGTNERDVRVYTVSYRFGVFSPTNLRIHAGDTVRFRNDGTLPIRVTADVPSAKAIPEFDSRGDIQPDGYFSYTFANTGIFGYHNYADDNESGVIIVR